MTAADIQAIRDALAEHVEFSGGVATYIGKKWHDECHPERIARLLAALEDAQRQTQVLRDLIREEAQQLNAWARESRSGGWSTHQVTPMRERADHLLRTIAAMKDAP